MPAGGGGRCSDCYWKSLLAKRIEMNTAGLANETMAKDYKAFAKWLAENAGDHKAAITINRYLDWFQVVDQRWGRIPDYKELLLVFGVDGLRKVLQVSKWLEQSGRVLIDKQAGLDAADRRRITQTLEKFPEESAAHKLLMDYHQVLLKRLANGTTSIRSVRLAITPAAALLKIAKKQSVMPPDQASLDLLLTQSPGQRAAVTGFVNYLHNTTTCKFVMKKTSTKSLRDRIDKSLEAEIKKLLANRDNIMDFEIKWIELSLAYHHQLTRKKAKSIATTSCTVSNKTGYTISSDKIEYFVPAPPC